MAVRAQNVRLAIPPKPHLRPWARGVWLAPKPPRGPWVRGDRVCPARHTYMYSCATLHAYLRAGLHVLDLDCDHDAVTP